MKIGTQVTAGQIPLNGAGRPSKWDEVWAAAEFIEDGNALPVEFDSAKEANKLRSCNLTARRLGFHLALRGNIVYVTRLNGRN